MPNESVNTQISDKLKTNIKKTMEKKPCGFQNRSIYTLKFELVNVHLIFRVYQKLGDFKQNQKRQKESPVCHGWGKNSKSL